MSKIFYLLNYVCRYAFDGVWVLYSDQKKNGLMVSRLFSFNVLVI